MSDPVFTIILCHNQGPNCVLHQQKIGTNADNWFFWTVVHGQRYEFAPFAGHQLIDGTHWYECTNCDNATFLELTSSRGRPDEHRITEFTPATVTPEPEAWILLLTGLALLAVSRLLAKRNRARLLALIQR